MIYNLDVGCERLSLTLLFDDLDPRERRAVRAADAAAAFFINNEANRIACLLWAQILSQATYCV